MPLASRPSSPASSSGYPGTAPGAGHRPPRDRDGPLEGLGWTLTGLGMVTQRDQNGPQMAWDGPVLPQTSLWGHSKPRVLRPSPRGHPLPSHAVGTVPLHWPGAALAVGQRPAGSGSGSDPRLPRNSRRGGGSGPRSQTPKFRCLGWASPRVPAHGRRSTAAAGTALAPTGGGCWASPGTIPAQGEGGGPR